MDIKKRVECIEGHLKRCEELFETDEIRSLAEIDTAKKKIDELWYKIWHKVITTKGRK